MAVFVAGATLPAWADGGAGGGGGSPGGADSIGGTGGAGQSAGANSGGGGGGAGATGGAGANGNGGSGTPGGAGGTPGSPNGGTGLFAPNGGSGGGGGAHGAVVSTAGTIGSGTGGNGGKGGDEFAGFTGSGGGGGAGGYGAGVTVSGSFTSSGTLTGGNGGNGGTGIGDPNGSGGTGGIGIAFGATGATLTNSGTIIGGNGGTAGGAGANAGAGGVGVSGSGLTIINNAAINGGQSGAGAQANAITFTGGTNVLELRSGFSFTGNVVAVSGGSDTLRLGGSANASFDVSQVGGGAQYQNFGAFQKTGTSTWTLSSTTGTVTPWAINAGTLAISADNNLGAASGGLSFGGGTLQLNAGFNLGGGRAITLNSGGGTVDTNGNSTTISQGIGGVGGLTKAGPGTLTLSGVSTYAGPTNVSAGILQAGAAGVFASGSAFTVSGRLDLNNFNQTIGSLSGAGLVTLGTATLTAGGDNSSTTFSGTLSDSGGLIKAGTGTLTLSGSNTYTGATTISTGTLALANFADISSSSVVTVNGGATFDISGNGGGALISTLAGGGAVQLGGNGLAIQNGSTEFSGAINGSGGLEIFSGTQTLSGVNGYTNATQIDGGATLALKGNGSIASSAFVGFAGAGAKLDISQTNAGATVAGLFSLGGNGVVGLGSKTLTITNGSSFAGVIQDVGIGGGTGGGLIIAAGGFGQDLSGVNTYTGATTIVAGGLLTLSGNGSIAQSSGVNLAGAGAQFDISAANGARTIKDLSGVAGSTVQLGNNALVVGTANSTTFAGILDDSSNPGGSLVKQGSGTLTLTGANTFSGGTTINAGLINFSALANFGTGSITLNGGGLRWATGNTIDISTRLAPLGASGGTFDTNGNNVTLGSVISGTGRLTKAGNGVLTLAAANAYSGGTTVTGGLISFSALNNFGSGAITLNGGGLQWASGSTADISSKLAPLGAGGGVFDTNGNTITFASALSGTGGLTKQGSGLLNLTANNTYTGATAVNAGTLAVNGSITSNVTVGSGGTLGGNGTIFGLVTNNGIIAPGNSIGTLTVNGSYTQAAGSTYQVEVNAQGQNDRINVSGAPGTATIQGGTVQVLAQQGSYANSTTYTILNATGGVAGTYAGVTSNFAFLTSSLSYNANNVFLTLALQQNAFSIGGITPNQKAVGAALDQSFANASGDFATVIGALAGLSTAQGPAALDALSGQPYADFGTMNTNNSAMFMNALGQQMAIARGASTGQRQALAQACDIAACDGVSPWGTWASALGGLGNVAGDGNASTLSYNFGGGAAGIDYRFDPRFLLGIGAGYTAGNLWVNNFMGRGTSDSVAVAAYGSFTQSGFYADALAGYAYFYNQMQRQIIIPGLQPRTANGAAGANQVLGQAEAGYKLAVFAPAQATLTPFGRFQASSVTQNGFNEWGAQSLSLNAAQQTTTSLRSTLGATLSGAIELGDTRTLDLDLRLGWQHEYANTSRPITAALAGAPFAAFTVYGATPQRDSAAVGFSARTAIAEATSVYLRYDGEIGSGTDNHALNLGVRFSW